ELELAVDVEHPTGSRDEPAVAGEQLTGGLVVAAVHRVDELLHDAARVGHGPHVRADRGDRRPGVTIGRCTARDRRWCRAARGRTHLARTPGTPGRRSCT